MAKTQRTRLRTNWTSLSISCVGLSDLRPAPDRPETRKRNRPMPKRVNGAVSQSCELRGDPLLEVLSIAGAGETIEERRLVDAPQCCFLLIVDKRQAEECVRTELNAVAVSQHGGPV